MSLFKNKITALFKSRKANVFILFLILAILFSVLTKLSRDYTKTVSFKIEKQNLPEDVVIVSDTLHSLNITLTTYGFKFLRYYLDKPSVVVNFEKLAKNDYEYYWTKSNGLADLVSQFEDNVKIESVTPDTLQFRFDKNATKKIPIQFNSKLEFISGFDIVNNVILQPDSIKVIGPQAVLDGITAIRTDTLVLKDVNKDIRTMVNLDLSDVSDQLKFSKEQILVNAKVEKFTEGFVDIPITISNLPDDLRIKYYPKVIKVYYYTSLSNFKTIKSSDFKAVCDFSSITEDTSFLTPKLVNIPDGVKNVRLETQRIEFITIR